MTSLPSENTAWGFCGTIGRHGEDRKMAVEAWPLASTAIAAATGCPATAVREFLDSRHGRHLADDVLDGLARGLALPAAIDAAVGRWMGWTIGRRTARETGIPQGLPYLTGFVTMMEVEAEAAI